MPTKEITIEEAESRLKRRLEINVFVLGLAFGIVLSILAELSMLPVKTTVYNGTIALAIDQSRLVIPLLNYYADIAVGAGLCLLLGLAAAQSLFGLNDKLTFGIEHHGKKDEVQEKWVPKFERIGSIHGYRVRSGYEKENDCYISNFTKPDSKDASATIRTDEKNIRMVGRIDPGVVALAKTLRDRIGTVERTTSAIRLVRTAPTSAGKKKRKRARK